MSPIIVQTSNDEFDDSSSSREDERERNLRRERVKAYVAKYKAIHSLDVERPRTP
jgi:hypothetical protein|tara:strand:- start:2369 stop:2533 length:165 start_codon:yes stop_codon:yes gene_type:complete